MYDILELSSRKRHWLLHNSNIPRRFLGVDRETIVAKTGSYPVQVDMWLDDFVTGNVIKKIGGLGTTGVGLLFDGEPGRGKTTHATTILQSVVRALPADDDMARRLLSCTAEDYGMHLRPVYYLTFPEFLARKKAMFEADHEDRRDLAREMDGYHGRAKEDWLNVRVLVLDDLGKEYGSKYDDASFDEILRSRYDKGLPTIVTTNVPLEQWADQYGPAMASFAKEAFVRVPVSGDDLRDQED